MKIALVQMRSSVDPARNVKEAEALVREAAATGATYVQTPEVSNIFDPDKDRLRAHIDANPGFIAPESRKNEILNLLDIFPYVPVLRPTRT